jgi:ATP-dependent Lon protease
MAPRKRLPRVPAQIERTRPDPDAPTEIPAPNDASEQVDLPVLPLRGETLYPIPEALSPFLVGRERSVAAIEEALGRDRRILAIAQRDAEAENISFEDLHEVGTEATITRMLKLPDGTTSVLVEGLRRVRVIAPTSEQPFLRIVGQVVAELDEDPAQSKAAMSEVVELFEKVVQLNETVSEDVFIGAMNADTPGLLADMVATALPLSAETHQTLLETRDVAERLRLIRDVLAEEIRTLELELEIREGVRGEVDAQQREFYLREQLRTIMKELGETNAQNAEIVEFRTKLETGRYPKAVAERGLKEIDRLNAMPHGSPEISVIRTYLEWLTELPWRTRTRDKTDINRAAEILDAHHHGLEKVKERLLEYIAVRHLSRRSRSPILCFVGPPGVGKTSLGQSIADALGRKFVHVSLGGVRDEAEIRGHRMTYIGSMPGRILQKMREAGKVNPVFMIDEIDKLGLDFRGDPAAALLEVLDPEQNHAFSDHYLELPYDLSKVIFIATANTLDWLPAALVDRMEVIDLPGYVEDEKLEIADRFLVARQRTEHGLDEEALTFERGALRRIVREYTREAGVRELDRAIATVARKRTVAKAEGQDAPWTVRAEDLPTYLGPPRYRFGSAETADSVAIATAVFTTPAGGDLLPIEVSITPGTGQVTLTGSLGDVIKESAHAALTYARANAGTFGFSRTNFSKIDIHVHVAQGALPKDGPSAGVAIATALISALSNRKVRHDVTMTGEITLRGRVLPVTGLKEKIMAAHRAGIREFLLPRSNRQDLVELPDHIREDLTFILAATVSDALGHALAGEG